MSKINDLIENLCPDGVEYRPITDVFDMRGGYTPSKNNPEYWTNGTVPWFRMEDIRENGHVLSDALQYVSQTAVKKNGLFPAYSIVLATSATIGEHALITVECLGNQRFTFFSCNEKYIQNVNMDFMNYYFYVIDDWCKDHLNQGSFASVDMTALKNLEIPVPPRPVQDEIVRILDEYTDLEAELEAKLSEEIKLKQKQYEFYRDELLTFGDDVERKRLGDKSLFKISRGVVISKPYVKEHSGKYPVYSSQTENDGCLGCIDTYAVDGERVTWTTDGAKAGTVFYRNGKYNITNVCGMIECLNATKINCKYLSYVFSIVAPNYVNKGMGNPKLMSNIVELIEIPVPPLQEQERIVKILDKYATYTRDMISALNTELESRKKQYAYYRDQLSIGF